jgi:hypothetical protein
MPRSGRTLAIVLLVVGLVLISVGVIYFTVAANELPSVLGRLGPNATGHRTTRGTAALALGAVSLVGAAISYSRARRHHTTA